jgi:hypothetical protein
MSLRTWEPGKTYFKHQQPDASTSRATRRAARQSAMDDAYEEVNRRDENKSRVSGISLRADSPDERTRREHNHIVERSRDKTKRAEASNIHLCSGLEHRLITLGKLLIEGTDASLPNTLRFHWHPDVPADQRVVKILSRRRSQREAE